MISHGKIYIASKSDPVVCRPQNRQKIYKTWWRGQRKEADMWWFGGARQETWEGKKSQDFICTQCHVTVPNSLLSYQDLVTHASWLSFARGVNFFEESQWISAWSNIWEMCIENCSNLRLLSYPTIITSFNSYLGRELQTRCQKGEQKNTPTLTHSIRLHDAAFMSINSWPGAAKQNMGVRT